MIRLRVDMARFTSQFLLWIFILGSMTLTQSACAPDPRPDQYIDPGRTMMRIETFQIRGVDQLSIRELRSGLATQQDPGWRAEISWMPIIGADPKYFNFLDWQRDIQRIRTFYHQRGYFNMEILSQSVLEDPQRNRVRLLLILDEGSPVRVTHIETRGLEELAYPSEHVLLRDQPLQSGQTFTQSDYLATRDAIEQRLRNAGYAYAQVSGRVHVTPEENTAEVYFFVDSGPSAIFGDIHVFGLEDIPEHYVRDAITIEAGGRYSPNALFDAQENVYDLGVFSMVTVLPAHEARELINDEPLTEEVVEEAIPYRPPSDDTEIPVEDVGEHLLEEAYEPEVPDEDEALIPLAAAPIPPNDRALGTLGITDFLSTAQQQAEARARLEMEVPVVVRLKEAKMWNVRVGAGVAAEGTRQDIRGLLNWSSRNFFGGLRRLEHFNALGYAWAPGLLGAGGVGNQGVILSSELRFVQPQFIERRTNLRLRAGVSRDVREGFSVWNPSFRLGVDRTFFRHLIVEAAYNLSYFNYSNIDEGLLDITATALGLDFQREFMLEYFEQAIALDYRNDPLDPTRGFLLRLSVQEAGRYAVGGNFDFIKPMLAAEGYVPINLAIPSVLALRSQLGTAVNIGRDTGVPVQSRLYSGGKHGMRSFGRRRLSYYTPTGEPIPIGGLTQFELSIEPRFRIVESLMGIGDLWATLFWDGATVLRGQFLADSAPNTQGVEGPSDVFSTLLHGIGAGAWWVTPVGPVRFDFAYTLSDVTNDERFRRCVDPATVGTPACVFVPLEDDPIQALISRYNFYISIGHSF